MGNPLSDGNGSNGKGHDFVKDPSSNPAGVKGRDFVSTVGPVSASAPRNPMDIKPGANPTDDELDKETAVTGAYPNYNGKGETGVGSVGNPAKPFKLNGGSK